MKYKIICLCGNPEFKEDFMREQLRLTLQGNVVISVGIFNRTNNISISDSMKILLDDIQRQKIAMSDEVFVINKHGYIEPRVQKEIEYAMICGKPIKYMKEHRERSIH